MTFLEDICFISQNKETKRGSCLASHSSLDEKSTHFSIFCLISPLIVGRTSLQKSPHYPFNNKLFFFFCIFWHVFLKVQKSISRSLSLIRNLCWSEFFHQLKVTLCLHIITLCSCSRFCGERLDFSEADSSVSVCLRQPAAPWMKGREILLVWESKCKNTAVKSATVNWHDWAHSSCLVKIWALAIEKLLVFVTVLPLVPQ